MTASTFTPRHPVNHLIQKCCGASACQRQPSEQRRFAARCSTSRLQEPRDVAVLGGGITGLATAYYLSQNLSNARISLFEGGSRLGGWLQSTSVDVGNGKVVFEQGPRNLRPSVPNGLVTLDLVRDLGMENRILMTSKNSVAAQNRFIYFPDRLVRMPGPGTSLWRNLSNVWSEAIFDGAISGILSEVNRPCRSRDIQDESVGSFISRRFGLAIADNIVSAIFHGIYAGDIYKLSARSILPGAWQTELNSGSVVKGFLDEAFGRARPVADVDLKLKTEYHARGLESDTLEAVKKSSIFTFKGGIGELSDGLEADLYQNSNVLIHKGTLVERLRLKEDEAGSKVEFTTYNALTKEDKALWDFDHIISTIPGSSLADITQDTDLLSPLRKTSAVTVMVVNLFYSNASILPVHGFGYLLPRSVPINQNPERALGVVFDSDASIGQDDILGTKVTVMLGGHWWDDFDTYPDENQGADMAKKILQRHLGISEEPRAVRVSLQKSCIPQYIVGHEDRMADTSKRLTKSFKGRLRVAGNSYTGVGLNDCIRAARDVVKGLVDDTGSTGLETYVGGKKFSWVSETTKSNY